MKGQVLGDGAVARLVDPRQVHQSGTHMRDHHLSELRLRILGFEARKLTF